MHRPRSPWRLAALLLLLPFLGACNVVSRTWTCPGSDRVERAAAGVDIEGSRRVEDGALQIELREVTKTTVRRYQTTVERTLHHGYPTELSAVVFGDLLIVGEVLYNWMAIGDSDDVLAGPGGYLLSLLPFVSADTMGSDATTTTERLLGERLASETTEEARRPAVDFEVAVRWGDATTTARTDATGKARIPLATLARAVVAKGATEDPQLRVVIGDHELPPLRVRLDDLLAALGGD